MLAEQWESHLRNTVAGLVPANGRVRIAVVGVGHELRSDDAAGVVVARLLEERVDDPHLLVVSAGPAPERCWRSLFPFRPHLILFVDAAEMGAAPGSVCWLEWNRLAGTSISTHTLPLPTLAAFLGAELSCVVALLGIQPGDTYPGTTLTPAVARAVESTAAALAALLQATEGAYVP